MIRTTTFTTTARCPGCDALLGVPTGFRRGRCPDCEALLGVPGGTPGRRRRNPPITLYEKALNRYLERLRTQTPGSKEYARTQDELQSLVLRAEQDPHLPAGDAATLRQAAAPHLASATASRDRRPSGPPPGGYDWSKRSSTSNDARFEPEQQLRKLYGFLFDIRGSAPGSAAFEAFADDIRRWWKRYYPLSATPITTYEPVIARTWNAPDIAEKRARWTKHYRFVVSHLGDIEEEPPEKSHKWGIDYPVNERVRIDGITYEVVDSTTAADLQQEGMDDLAKQYRQQGHRRNAILRPVNGKYRYFSIQQRSGKWDPVTRVPDDDTTSGQQAPPPPPQYERVKTKQGGDQFRMFNPAIRTNSTCDESCWTARDEVCRCSCGGRNHGVLRDATGTRPQRTSRINGYWYRLKGIGRHSDVYQVELDAQPLRKAMGLGYDTRKKGYPIILRPASESQIAAWPELAAYRNVRYTYERPYLVWERDDHLLDEPTAPATPSATAPLFHTQAPLPTPPPPSYERITTKGGAEQFKMFNPRRRPQRHRNPATSAAVERARRAFEGFHGVPPRRQRTETLDLEGQAWWLLGTGKDGAKTEYVPPGYSDRAGAIFSHEWGDTGARKNPGRARYYVSADGKNLLIRGGFTVGDRGIVG